MKGYWTEFGVGIIMIASPWLFGFSDVSLAKWCNVFIGLLLVLMSAWTIFGEHPQTVSAIDEPQKGRVKNKTSLQQK